MCLGIPQLLRSIQKKKGLGLGDWGGSPIPLGIQSQENLFSECCFGPLTQEVETWFMDVYELVFCEGIILSAYDSAATLFHELFTPAAALMP